MSNLTAKSHHIYSFNDFTVDIDRGCLLRAGQEVRLRPKVYEALKYLIENNNRLVTKAELIEALWPDSCVTDDSLVQCLVELRRALGDEAQVLIRTVPKRGYIFAAEVTESDRALSEAIHAKPGEDIEATPGQDESAVRDTSRAAAGQAARLSERTSRPEQSSRLTIKSARWLSGRKFSVESRRHLWRSALIIVVLALLALTLSRFYSPDKHSKAIDSIAVLPLANESADPNLEYLCDGITESIINRLSQLPQLKVMASSTVFRYKHRPTESQTIGQELGVRAVLTGRVTQVGDRLIMNIELIDTADGTQVWGEKYNQVLSDILAVQEEIPREISAQLRLKLTGEEQRRLAKKYTESTEAYQLYLKGRYYLNKRTEEGFKKGVEYFEQAIARDPSYALAYAGLADSYILLGAGDYSVLAPREAMIKAKAAATKTLEMDETIAEAHTSLGFLNYIFDWDWPGAQRHYQRAIELNPNYATAHHWYSLYLTAMLRMDEAIAEAHRAQELDPFSLIINTDLGVVLYREHQYDRAIEQFKKTLEMEPNFVPAHWNLGRALVQKRIYGEALTELQKATELSNHNPVYLAALGHAYAVSGRKEEATKILNELKQLSTRRYILPNLIAMIYVGLDEKDQAFVWLEKAYQERSDFMIVLKVDPALDGLRSDLRFQDLLRRVGLSR